MPLTENQIEQTSLSSGGRTAPDEPYLLTPGPLTTSLRTKQAMLHDVIEAIADSLNAIGVKNADPNSTHTNTHRDT